MDQRGDRDTRECREAKFLRQHDPRERVLRRPAIRCLGAEPEKAERSHPSQDLARNKALLLPVLAIRLDFFLDETTNLIAKHLVLFGEERRALGLHGQACPDIAHLAHLLIDRTAWLDAAAALSLNSSNIR